MMMLLRPPQEQMETGGKAIRDHKEGVASQNGLPAVPRFCRPSLERPAKN
jgi:hypothetical protein